MATDFHKRFQRKLVDAEDEESESEKEVDSTPVQLGFTEGSPSNPLILLLSSFDRKSRLSFRRRA